MKYVVEFKCHNPLIVEANNKIEALQKALRFWLNRGESEVRYFQWDDLISVAIGRLSRTLDGVTEISPYTQKLEFPPYLSDPKLKRVVKTILNEYLKTRRPISAQECTVVM